MVQHCVSRPEPCIVTVSVSPVLRLVLETCMQRIFATTSSPVFPCLPVRPWGLSVPKRLRHYLQRDKGALNAALRCFQKSGPPPATSLPRHFPNFFRNMVLFI